jgi:hypothetical protein
MKKVKEVLDGFLQMGELNWERLEQKIHVALEIVDNKFDGIRDDGKLTGLKVKDSLSFATKNKDCIKLIHVKFLNGELWCDGLQLGKYDLKHRPYFTTQPRIF